MSLPHRDTTAGRVYLDLQARARREERPTDELFLFYVLERFLCRLSRSSHRNRLVLKGGMLLAVFDGRRATRDIDLLAQSLDNDIDTVATLVRDVLRIEIDDGVAYETDSLTARVIREQDIYTGMRLAVPAQIHRAQQPLRLDVNVGDPVTPAPVEIDYPSLLGDSFPILGYPLVTLLAEKIVTMIDRGDATTRDRDFADVALLISRHDIDATELAAAIKATAVHRKSQLRPLRDVLVSLAQQRQADWARFVDKSGLVGQAPELYSDAINAVVSFADPILDGSLMSGTWQAARKRWSPADTEVIQAVGW